MRLRNNLSSFPRIGVAAASSLVAASVLFVAQADAELSRFALSAPQRDGGARTLRFVSHGRAFDLTLAPNRDLVAPGLRAIAIDPAGTRTLGFAAAWIGRATDGSEARVRLEGDRVRGHLRGPAGTLVFEPSSDGRHDVRASSELLAGAAPLACGAGTAGPTGENAYPAGPVATSPLSAMLDATGAFVAPGSTAALVEAGPKVLELSLVLDAAFYRRFGDASADEAVALMNQVDAITRRDLGVALRIVQLVVFTSDTQQPFSSTSDAAALLRELGQARANDPAARLSAGAVTHLLTGRDLAGSNGMAWMSAACTIEYGTSLASIQSKPGYLHSILVAHELGHNVGASHDGDPNGNCPDTSFGWLMWPWLSGDLRDEFSSCSRASVASRLVSMACIDATVPATCGDGIVDLGEDCDAGADPAAASCCRKDCSFELAGIGCGDSGNACFDATCDGGGSCTAVANDAICDTGDACTAGVCSGGTCVPTDAPREFSTAKVTLRLAADGTVASAKLAATAPMVAIGSDPMNGGIQFTATIGSETGWSQEIPASAWTRRGSSYSYKADVAAYGKLRSAKVRFDALTGLATFKITLSHPLTAMMPQPTSIFVLAGNRIDGQCAAEPLGTCTQKGGSFTCL
jgi:hypothetical protein